MQNQINELDPDDIGLQQVMGDRFVDATKGEAPVKPTPKTNATPDAEYKPVADWHPQKSAPNWYDNLKSCVKSVAVFGGLNLLIFYWQQAELMDSSIAVPSMCVCALLAGLGIGKNLSKK